MKVLIVDNEPLARSALTRLCGRSRDVDVVGEAASGAAAIQAAETLCPDVMLIDVDLPDMSGFEVLRLSQADRKPIGIMVSARGEHAVAAFIAGALDYLLKPVSADRFADSIERARRQCDSASAPKRPPLLVGERKHRLYPLSAENVDYIEADGNYVTIHAASAAYRSRDSVKRLSAELTDAGFVRVQRSLLINIRAVSFVEAMSRGRFKFTLSSGPDLHSSSSYRDSILRVLPMRRPHRGPAS
jgi:two-component system, LytTR family, response regulator